MESNLFVCVTIQNAFDYFDTDKSGAIDFQELQEALVQIG